MKNKSLRIAGLISIATIFLAVQCFTGEKTYIRVIDPSVEENLKKETNLKDRFLLFVVLESRKTPELVEKWIVDHADKSQEVKAFLKHPTQVSCSVQDALVGAVPCPDKMTCARRDVAQLFSECQSIRESGIANLFEAFSPQVRRLFSQDIVIALEKRSLTPQELKLLTYVDITEGIRERLLNDPRLDLPERARLGDEKATKELADRFCLELESSDDENGRMRRAKLDSAAFPLVLIKSPLAKGALIRGLSSSKFMELEDLKLSYPFVILCTWWHFYPEEPLRDEFMRLFVDPCQSAHAFQNPEIQDYVRRLERYFQKDHNMDVKFNAPFFVDGCVIKRYNVPVDR